MRTPYDPAIRIRRREIEDVRVSIGVEMRRLTEVEHRMEHVTSAAVREAEQAAREPMMSSYAYLTRMKAERARLDADRRSLDAGLDRLRAKAAAAYGSLNAIESAADSFRAEEARLAASAEQSRIDDFAAAAYLRARRGRNVA